MNRSFLIIGILAFSTRSLAQDTHYWTQQFGTRSALLGGAVVGGSNDNTAIYYNPGGLGFMDTASISINGNLYSFEKFRIQNALGKQADFKSSDIGSVPLLVSGMFPSRNPKLKIGYGIFQPVSFDFKAVARLDGSYPIIEDSTSPGDEESIFQRNVNSHVKEVMVVLGLAYRLSEHFSIGLSNMFIDRTQSYTSATLARVFLNDSSHTLVMGNNIQSFSYSNIRYAAKIGIAWQGRRISAGLTFTTPGVRILGSGSVGADYTGSNIKLNGIRQDVVADDLQSKLKADFKSPMSFSAGLNWKLGRSTLAFSGQYFGSIGAYDVMRGAPGAFVRPASAYPDLSADQFLRVKSGARSVLNGVIGFEHPLSNTLTLQCSFRNDMTYYDKSLDSAKGITPDITTWDIYTLALGTAIHYGLSSITVGLTISTGTDNHHAQQGNYSQPSGDSFLRGATTITKASYSSFGFVLGYTYNFRKL
jgi:hypothetical protein